jgi:hypothetical protein
MRMTRKLTVMVNNAGKVHVTLTTLCLTMTFTPHPLQTSEGTTRSVLTHLKFYVTPTPTPTLKS